MTGLFSAFLCCCSRQKVKDEVDEEQNQQLLSQPGAPQQVNYGSTAIDDHKAKERLNVIVRSKQGKMVNVLARVPFNLRDDAHSNQGNTSSPSRSTRSFSANISRTAILHDDSSRASSPKPSPSISRSESVSSMHNASTSQTLLEEGQSGFESVLKARLISASKNKQRNHGRRGRSTTRQGRFGLGGDEVGDYAAPTLGVVQSVDTVRAEPGTSNSIVDADGRDSDSPNGILTPEPPSVKPLSEEDNIIIRTISDNISATIKDGFKIQDVGTLALSWGE